MFDDGSQRFSVMTCFTNPLKNSMVFKIADAMIVAKHPNAKSSYKNLLLLSSLSIPVLDRFCFSPHARDISICTHKYLNVSIYTHDSVFMLLG